MAENSVKPMVLVTGASGFVGRHVCACLHDAGFTVRAAVRQDTGTPARCERVVIGEVGPDTEWAEALRDVELVVHLVSHAPVSDASEEETAAAFQRVNTEGTRCLLDAAVKAGVRRLIYVSTIKVNGESSRHGVPFTEASTPQPQDAYGRSKLQAEQLLMHAGKQHQIEIVILRPPLVYGPGVKGNFSALMRMVERGVPLPLKQIVNRRSMVYVLNLADAIRESLLAPQAANQTYLVSDDEDVSTPELIGRLAALMQRPARLWPVPAVLLQLAGRATGRQAMMERLTGSLSMDVNKIRTQLGWTPPYTLDEGLHSTVEWYRGVRRQ